MTAGKRAQTAIAAANAAGTVTAAQVLDGHVTLDLECLDRIYLNGYVPNLQVGGQVVTFLTQHLGNPVPSPALFGPIGDRFRQAVARFADQHAIPVVRFTKEQRKAEVANGTRYPVPQMGLQEFQRVFTGYDRGRSDGQPGPPRYGFEKAERRVTCYYFYVWDDDFGPGFIKICAYFPTRRRCGSTVTSGPNGRRPSRASAAPSSPTGSLPATIPPGCRRSATGSARAPSGCSWSAGWPACRCH